MRKDPYDPEFYKSLQGELAIQERLKGRQPMIDIAGDIYFLSVHWGQLNPKNDFVHPPLNINDLPLNAEETRYEFLYHKATKSVVGTIREMPDTLPEGTFLVQLPAPVFLDPIGMAQLNGYADRAYLAKIPQRMYIQAEVYSSVSEVLSRRQQEPKRTIIKAAKSQGKHK